MEKKPVSIKSIDFATHDVLRIVTGKPDGVDFVPGQATEIFIDKSGWENEGKPFTFTCLPNMDYLEFMIKTYPSHNGVTKELLKLQAGDKLIINDIFGAINYKGEGTFIAGGAGITPFVAILRNLKAHGKIGNNKLLFANKTSSDIILEEEFNKMLGKNFMNILSEEESDKYAHGYITANFIKENTDLKGYFYVCGPPKMMEAVEKELRDLQVHESYIVTEKF
ncbi:flavodoxin reductase [Arenibacter sp. 6A1]|uniref:flavodoxin reductase n=1 Tax=Arenibacter sp. 6A1 TaxID=2720391 RepID=UPI001447781E|nr:flavodoxin reductase [Arenibacter sp. 6A1]NKI27617.1 flavodoxin reductase [Arenibacter sp. 6A1]